MHRLHCTVATCNRIASKSEVPIRVLQQTRHAQPLPSRGGLFDGLPVCLKLPRSQRDSRGLLGHRCEGVTGLKSLEDDKKQHMTAARPFRFGCYTERLQILSGHTVAWA